MEKKDTLEICQRVAQLRAKVAGARGKSNFAKMLGISPSTYDYYESVRVPPATTLVKIAEFAKVDLRWLLTGEGDAEPDMLFGHPAVRRAAQILDRFPDASNPLSAFLDLLEAALEMQHKKKNAWKKADIPDFTDRKVCAQNFEQTPEPVVIPTGKLEDASKYILGNFKSNPTAGWIPVLGRSAAGVPHFWADSEDTAGLTDLGDLISRHVSMISDLDIHPARFEGKSDEKVEIISLPRPLDDRGLVEFVNAPRAKKAAPGVFAVRIDGDSMSPEIKHGDLVLLSIDSPAEIGEPAVVQLDNAIGVTCKLYHPKGNQLHLVPINEACPPISVSQSKLKWALKVIGCIRPG